MALVHSISRAVGRFGRGNRSARCSASPGRPADRRGQLGLTLTRVIGYRKNQIEGTKSAVPSPDLYREVLVVARPPAKELTQRELEVMHVFWRLEQATAMEARDDLARRGPDLTY